MIRLVSLRPCTLDSLLYLHSPGHRCFRQNSGGTVCVSTPSGERNDRLANDPGDAPSRPPARFRTLLRMPPVETLTILAVVLSLGIFVQASAGFAAGLLIVPALLWAGEQIPEAQTALLVATIPQNIAGVWSFRDQITVREIAFPGALRLAALPVGIAMLHNLEALEPARLRQIVGGVVLVVTLAIIVFRPQPHDSLHPAWGWLAFLLSGFLQGLVGMGGPAMVLWVQAHDWGTRRTRGFLFAMYLISLLPALGVLYCFFGNRIVVAAVGATILIPWLWIVSQAGLKTGTWLGRDRLRRVTLGLLLLMGISGLAAPLFE